MTKKVLIIDDSALMRRILSDIINSDKRFELAASASNGLEGLDVITTSNINFDAMILDINMPKLNGIQLMERLEKIGKKIPTLVVSTLAYEGASETLRCLELGAFDFVTKPDSFIESSSGSFKQRVLKLLCATCNLDYDDADSQVKEVKAAAPAKAVSERTVTERAVTERTVHERTVPERTVPERTSSEKNVSETPSVRAEAKPAPAAKPVTQAAKVNAEPQTPAQAAVTLQSGISAGESRSRLAKITCNKKKFSKNGGKKLVALACSTGGPKALQQVVPKLPKNLDAPMIIVQHMPENFTFTLAARLNELSEITVKEASDGEVLTKGIVYIAKGGRHMRIKDKGNKWVISIDDDPPVNSLKPCADVMYESLKNVNIDELTCVVLTGMGNDGTEGISGLCETKNTYVISQDEESSTVYGMPRMVFEAGAVDEVRTLTEIADAITKNVGVQ